MSSERQIEPIRRPGRSGGEPQARKSQPGSYRPAWQKDVTDPPPGVREPVFRSLAEVPADLRARAEEKAKWVSTFVRDGCPRGELMNYAKRTAEAKDLPEDAVPPYSTLNGWAKQFLHWGLLGLVDRVRKDAGKRRSLSDKIRGVLTACIIGARYSTTDALDFLSRVLPGVPLPPYHKMWREIQAFTEKNPHLRVLLTGGETEWRNVFRLALPGVDFPAGFRWAIDSTLCDVLVRVRDTTKPDGWDIARLVLTIVEDVGSRMLLTFNLSFTKVDSRIVLGTVRRLIYPGANYPDLPTVGLPHEILVDCGPEYLGDFERALSGTPVELIKTAPGQPEQNGRAERLLGTIKKEVFEGLPGNVAVQKAFNPYRDPKKEDRKNLERLKYDPHREVIPARTLLTVEQLEARLLAWASLYNRRTHPSLEANPERLREAMDFHELVKLASAA